MTSKNVKSIFCIPKEAFCIRKDFCIPKEITLVICITQKDFCTPQKAHPDLGTPLSPVPASSSNMGSPGGSLPDLEGTGFCAITMEVRQWAPRRLRFQKLNKLLGALWLASPLWKQVQPLVPVALIQQDLETCLDRVTALLGPSGPMAQGHPMTIGTQGVDLIPSQVLMEMTKVHFHPSA